MKRRSVKPLGEAEMEMLQHVWDLKRATVSEVHERVLGTRPIAYTTVMTLLKRLADKGYLHTRKEGNAHVYEPAKGAEEVRGHVLSEIIQKVFRGSPASLVQTLVKKEDLSNEERAEILKLVERLRSS